MLSPDGGLLNGTRNVEVFRVKSFEFTAILKVWKGAALNPEYANACSKNIRAQRES